MRLYRKIKAIIYRFFHHQVVITINTVTDIVDTAPSTEFEVDSSDPITVSVPRTVFKCASKHKTRIPLNQTRPPRCKECGEALL